MGSQSHHLPPYKHRPCISSAFSLPLTYQASSVSPTLLIPHSEIQVYVIHPYPNQVRVHKIVLQPDLRGIVVHSSLGYGKIPPGWEPLFYRVFCRALPPSFWWRGVGQGVPTVERGVVPGRARAWRFRGTLTPHPALLVRPGVLVEGAGAPIEVTSRHALTW